MGKQFNPDGAVGQVGEAVSSCYSPARSEEARTNVSSRSVDLSARTEQSALSSTHPRTVCRDEGSWLRVVL